MVDNTLEGVMDVLVTGGFHGWFQQHRIQEIAHFYGVRWQDLQDYAINELGYDTDGDEFTNLFGEKNDYLW